MEAVYPVVLCYFSKSILYSVLKFVCDDGSPYKEKKGRGFILEKQVIIRFYHEPLLKHTHKESIINE
jgi:hypothetical protein